MSVRTIEPKNLKPEHKDIWHPYGLQSLTEGKFVEVVGKIMKGDHALLALKAGCANIHIRG